MNKLLLLFGATLWMLGCGHGELIPRKALLSTAAHWKARLSGDGLWLTYEGTYHGVKNLYARRLPDGVEYPLTKFKRRGVDYYRWLHDNRTILYFRDNDGDENWALRSVDLQTGLELMLTEPSGVKAEIMATSPQVSDTVIVGMNARDRRYFDAYRLDVRSGRMVLMFQNDHYAVLLFDMQLRLRLAANETDQAWWQYFLMEPVNNTNTYTARLHKVLNVDDSPVSYPLNFHRNGSMLYWLSNEGQELSALIAENLETGESRVLYQGRKADLSSVVVHPLTGEPALVTEKYTIPELHVVTPAVKAGFDRIKSFFTNQSIFEVTSTTLNFQKWILAVSRDIKPISYYMCDLTNETHPCEFLFHMHKELEKYTMSPVRAVEVMTRDNLTEVCFLTFPHDSVDPETGFPLYPLPTVVFVHGGPWANDRYKFNEECQLMASRGYAVMQCNFRGSIGYGKKLFSSGNGEWGRKMQDDLYDAVDWAVGKNYSLRDKIAIMGGSYGGYAALAGLTFTPDTYACAVDMSGPSNLITLLNSIPPDWKTIFNTIVHRVGGSPETEEGRKFLKSRSPFFYADLIRKPLLITQGANDPRVKQQESDQIVEALRAHQIPFTYLLFPDEGHGIIMDQNYLTLWSFIEHFLQQCLGGDAEPFGDELQSSKLIVRIVNGETVRPFVI